LRVAAAAVFVVTITGCGTREQSGPSTDRVAPSSTSLAAVATATTSFEIDEPSGTLAEIEESTVSYPRAIEVSGRLYDVLCWYGAIDASRLQPQPRYNVPYMGGEASVAHVIDTDPVSVVAVRTTCSDLNDGEQWRLALADTATDVEVETAQLAAGLPVDTSPRR